MVTTDAGKLVHELNNDLALALGLLEILAGEAEVSTVAHDLAIEALAAVERAAERVAIYQRTHPAAPVR
jgi:hypothetical protein